RWGHEEQPGNAAACPYGAMPVLPHVPVSLCPYVPTVFNAGYNFRNRSYWPPRVARSVALGDTRVATRTTLSHAASTVFHTPAPTPARSAAPYAAPSSASTVSTG